MPTRKGRITIAPFPHLAPVSVLSIPDYRGGNPYQSNLEKALSEEVTYGNYDSLLPVCRSILFEDITVVHLHWLSAFFTGETYRQTVKRFFLFCVWLVLIRMKGIPIVWTVHNVRIHDSQYPRFERAFKRRFILSGFCRRFIVHCTAVQEDFLTEYNLPHRIRERIEIIPHGHYLDNYENDITQEAARESLDLPQSATVFLFFGNLCPYKGIEGLIDTFQMTDLEDSHLLVVGNPSSEEFRRILEGKCAGHDRIHTTFEFVPDDDIQGYMNAADVAVLPFRDITTSGSAILAMSFGKALIVPRLGCLPELLGPDGAEIYEPSEPNALQSAMRSATNRNLSEMGAHNESVVANYDWETIAEETERVYEAAISRARERSTNTILFTRDSER